MSIVDDRVKTHGDPVRNMQLIARRWSQVLGHKVTAKQVARCMYELHVVRHREAPVWDPAHRQHAKGYIEIEQMIDDQGS